MSSSETDLKFVGFKYTVFISFQCLQRINAKQTVKQISTKRLRFSMTEVFMRFDVQKDMCTVIFTFLLLSGKEWSEEDVICNLAGLLSFWRLSCVSTAIC